MKKYLQPKYRARIILIVIALFIGLSFIDFPSGMELLLAIDTAPRTTPFFIDITISADIYAKHANNLYKQGKYEEALPFYTRVVELAPNVPETYGNRGLVYLQLNEFEKAIADFDRANRLSNRDAKLYYARGYAHYRLANYQQAIQDFTQMLLMNEDFQAYFFRGLSYHAQNNHLKAIQDFTSAIHFENISTPQLVDVYRTRAESYYAIGNVSKGNEDSQKASELSAENP